MESINKKKLANLIIAGVNKAGSTSLFHYLAAHPDVCGSKDKETCYFLPLLYHETIPPLIEYEKQFLHCNNAKYRMEATPAYVFGGEKIASEIHTTLGSVKIIIILKDPVDRLISFYQRKKATFQLSQNMDLGEYVKMCLAKSADELDLRENQVYTGISLGLYHNFLEPWLHLYGSNCKIVFFDDLKKNTGGFMKDIAKWLEIDERFYDDFEFDVKNKSLNYKNRMLHRIAVSANNAGQRLWRNNPDFKKKILGLYYKFNGTVFENKDSDTIKFLRNYFKPHNEQLQKILIAHGIENLPDWLNPVKETA
ncbi:MAG: sulfotransferase domain-containing protein [Bacteroidetes bacterium]|nr:sulfotransferase domain-containing protein [Bacteroidota bacterium]